MTQKKFCHILGILALFIWSAVLLYFYGSGRVNDYIRPEYLRDLSLVAGIGLGVLAVFNLLNVGRVDHVHEEEHGDDCGSCCGHDHGHDHDHGDGGHNHEHDHEDNTIMGNATMLLVMVVPVLMAASFSQDRFVSVSSITNKGMETNPDAVAGRMKDGFGSNSKKAPVEEPRQIGGGMEGVNDGSSNPVPEENTTPQDEWEYTLADLEKVVDRSKEGNLMLTVDQLFYTTGDEELQHVLDGQPVETIGQVIPEEGYDPKGNRLRLFTLMVTCCAADAQPISLPVEFDAGAPEYKEMEWVKVSGTMIYPMENGRKQAVLKVKSMEKTEEPMDYFMF